MPEAELAAASGLGASCGVREGTLSCGIVCQGLALPRLLQVPKSAERALCLPSQEHRLAQEE